MPLLIATLLAGLLAAPPTAIGAQGDCSQPVSTGAGPVASDCLFILRVAVGLQACSPRACVCNVNGDGNTTASDALTCLSKAVGGSVALVCPCNTTTTSTTTTTTMDGPPICINDGNCSNDHCVCSDCDDDLFCSNPDNSCTDNGVCNSFVEGCVCVDCMTHPECLDN